MKEMTMRLVPDQPAAPSSFVDLLPLCDPAQADTGFSSLPIIAWLKICRRARPGRLRVLKK
jgi:hypothetical protein